MIKLSYVDFVLWLSISALIVFGLNLALIPNNTTVGAISKTILPLNIINSSSTGTGTTTTTANVAATELTDKSTVVQMATASLGAPSNKTFYLFNADTGSNENLTHIPHDTFAPDVIAVNKGDTVNIIYYNNEPIEGDPHTFTIGAPYDINVIVNPQQHSTIHFKANMAGAFQFYCSVHLPTMRGELVVLP